VTPSEKPQDIYQAVADQASALLARGCAEGNWLALRWDGLLGGKIPRSLAKQIVMTKAYGATHKSLMDDVDDLLEQLDCQGFAFAREERPQARAWLAKVMKAAISDRIGSAERIMKWLQQTAAIVARYGKKEDGRAPGLRWRVPTGWPWVMAYGAMERRNAHVRIDGSRATALVYAESDREIDRKAQTDSVSPNVIHALDAAALVFALEEMGEVTAVAAIHDCVGGLAPEMGAIGRAVRVGFAQLYAEFDPLTEIHEAALALVEEAELHRLCAPPAVGMLEVRRVIGAGYFFS
jgi:DNA-directed RNA polymerase